MEIKNELSWIREARANIGVSEKKGEEHNPLIIKWLIEIDAYPKANRAWWREDETPWCGVFVAHCLGSQDRFVVPHWYRAKAWADSDLMTKLDKPAYGSIVVFNRKGGGHVGFVVGKTKDDKLMVLGGNQGDKVGISAFNNERVIGFYWASYVDDDGNIVKSIPLEDRYNLPILDYNGKVSTNEA